MMRTLVLFLTLCGFAFTQGTLMVNNQSIAGLNTTLLVGTAYIPAEAFARALGATFAYDPATRTATFASGGNLAAIIIYNSPLQASNNNQALAVNGQSILGPGGIIQNGVVYVPVQGLANAFGASTNLETQAPTTQVQATQARLRTFRAPSGVRGDSERFVLEFDSPVPLNVVANEALNTVRFRFEGATITAAQAGRLANGQYFSEAVLEGSPERTDLRLTLRPGMTYRHFETPEGSGFSVVIDVFPLQTASLPVQPAQPLPQTLPQTLPQNPVQTPAQGQSGNLIILDPGHGGADTGLTYSGRPESQLTLELARGVQSALSARGYASRLTRDSDLNQSLENRSNAGVGADLFVSLHGGTVGRGQFNVYYLGDADALESLNMAIRRNAETAANTVTTDSLRRRLLLNLVPDLSRGATLARRLSVELAQESGLRAAQAETAAPLYVLGGAAGRGILLELNGEDMNDTRLAEALATALIRILTQP